MDEYIKELRLKMYENTRKSDAISTEISKFRDALNVLDAYNIGKDDAQIELGKLIVLHKENIKRISDEYMQMAADIRNYQSKCDHIYKSTGMDSHHTYYECTKCGHEYKE